MKKKTTLIDFDYAIDYDLFSKKPYDTLLKGYNELFPRSKPCLRLEKDVLIYNKPIKILLTQDIKGFNRKTKKEEILKRKPLIQAYIDGFYAGVKYFEENYKVSTDTLFGNQFKYYERNLHNLYFHETEKGEEGGWMKYMNWFPFIFSYNEIYKFGYYAGLVHNLEILKHKHNTIFANFDNHSTDKEENISETKTIRPIFKNNFDNIDSIEVYNHFKSGLVDKGYISEQELNEYLKSAFELKTVPDKLFKIKDAPKKAMVEAVFYKYYKNVAGKIFGKQTQYAALLGDYFEGYKTKSVSSNFSKSVY